MVELPGSEEASMHDGEIVFDDELLLDAESVESDSSPHRERFVGDDRSTGSFVRERRGSGLRVGEMFAGKYRIQRVHRASALGVTIDALHVQLDQRVAIKLLSCDPQARVEAVARFLRGARSAVQMRSEHVARVLDVGTLSSGAPYVVSEYLSGSDLRHVLRVREALPVREAVAYALQACEALADGHGLGLVHRNLKPSNLYLTRKDGAPCLKVLDFFTSEDPLSDAAINRAGMGAALESFAYLAPEQIREPNAVDARADIWALGAILHEMLSGAVLFDADSTPGLLAAIAADSAPPLSHSRSDIPVELEGAVLRCLAKERSERFPTVLDLATELASFADGDAQSSLDRVAKGLGRRARSTRPPPLPRGHSRAIVHVPTPANAEPKPAGLSLAGTRRFVELVATGIGFGCAAAIGALAAIHSMQGALSVAAPRSLVAELSPALTAAPVPTPSAATVVMPPALRAPAPALQARRTSPRTEVAPVAPAAHKQTPSKLEPHVVINDSAPKPIVAKNMPAKELFDDAN